jgi:hypothetical protein
MIGRAEEGDMAAGRPVSVKLGDATRPCKSPVFRLYHQGICLFGACQALFFRRCFACYFAARAAFTGIAPLFMRSLVLGCTPSMRHGTRDGSGSGIFGLDRRLVL